MYSSPPSPVELLSRARAGQESALADLFDRHEADLRRRVADGLPKADPTDEAVDDLLLETYLVALRRLEEFRARRQDAFGSWLARIADLRLAEALRNATRRTAAEPEPAPEAPIALSAAVAEPLPAEPLPAEPLPAEPLPAEPLPAEPLPAEPLPAEPLPAESLPAEPLPAEPLPAESLPAEPLPAEPLPAESLPAEPLPAEPLPAESLPAESPLAESPLAESPPSESPPSESPPVPTRAAVVLEIEAAGGDDETVLAEVQPLAEEDPAADRAEEGPTQVLRLVESDGLTLFASAVRIGVPESGAKALYASALGEFAALVGHEPGCGLADPAVAAALSDARERRDRGEGLTDEALAREHPEIADGIRAGLAALPAIRALLREESPADDEIVSTATAATRVRGLAAGIILGPPTLDMLVPLDPTDLPEEWEEEDATAGPAVESRPEPDEAGQPAPAPVADAAPPSEDLSGLIEAIDSIQRAPRAAPGAENAARALQVPAPERRSGRFAKYALGATILAVAVGAVLVEMHLRNQRDEAVEIARQIEAERAAKRLREQRARLASTEAELERERDARAGDATALERERRERLARDAALAEERMANESERTRSRSALRSVRALGLANASRHIAGEDSMCSLILATKAASESLLPDTYGPLHEALRGSRARWMRRSSGMKPADAARFEGALFSSSGKYAIAWSAGTNLVTVWDMEGHEQALVPTGSDRIWGVACSPANDTFVIAVGDGVTDGGVGHGSASIHDTAGNVVTTLQGHTDDVVSVGYSPPGDRILTLSLDGTARLWDLAGQELAVLPVDANARGGSAAFSSDGSRLLTAGNDGSVSIWTKDGEPITEFDAPGRLESARFAPGADKVLTTVESGAEAQLLSLKGDLLTIYPSPSVTVGLRGPYRNLYAEFAPTGDRILTASQDGVARLWSLDGEPLAVLTAHAETYLFAAFSPHGDRIVTASADGTARLWDAQGQVLEVLDQHEGAVTAAAFSPSGDHVLTVGTGGLAILSEVRDGEVPVLVGHTGPITQVCVTSDRIVTAGTDRTARVWDMQGRELAVLAGHADAVRTVEFSPGGDFVLTRSDDGTAKLWHKGGDELATFRGRERDVWSATLSLDGKRVLLGCGDGKARLCAQLGDVIVVFDPAAVEGIVDPERVVRARERAIWSATFSRDGSRVFTASGEGDVNVWDLDGNHLRSIPAQGVRLRHSPGGQHWLALDRGSWAWSLRGAGGEVLRTEVGENSACFSSAGDVVLGAGAKAARLLPTRVGDFDASDFPTFAHDDRVLAAVFSPDETRIATACADGAARLWSRDGTLLAILRADETPVVGVCFTPDGERLVTAAQDGTARVWLVDGTALRSVAARRVLRDLDEAERRRFAKLLGDSE